jgi:hypothetical protein
MGRHSSIQIPEILEGYALHIIENLPGGQKIHIIGVYSPSDNTLDSGHLKEEFIKHDLLQTTEWEEKHILLIAGHYSEALKTHQT